MSMNQETMTLPTFVSERLTQHSAVKNAGIVIGASLLIALSAQAAIPLPFSPVPMTLQPLAILLIGAVLGARRGAAAAVLYLMEGAAGLPFFSHARGGIGHLLGPTGGYLFAFPVAAFVAGWFAERGWNRSVVRGGAGLSLALAVILFGGWAWLALAIGPAKAYAVGIAPFLIGDLVKIAIAALLLRASATLTRPTV